MKDFLNIIGNVSFVGIVIGIILHIWMPGEIATKIIQTSLTIFTAAILLICGYLATEKEKK
jgi:uncharacterized membrane protein YraQ (UPF0718 family)